MAIAKITSWLADPYRSFEHGRALYEQYGKDVLLQALLRGGNSPYQSSRLFDALSELNTQLQPEEAKPVQRVIPDLTEFSGPLVDPIKSKPEYDSLPEAIKEVTRIKNMHKRRADQLYIEIAFTESEEQRLDMGLTMLEDYNKVQECWGIIDGYRETGKVLETKKVTLEEDIAELSVVDKMNSVRNIRTYLSKDRKLVANMPEGRKKAKVLSRIQENALKLQLLERSINDVV